MASEYEWPVEMTAGVMWEGEIRRAAYTLNDAARAWQAFRDWCDGTAEQWQQYAESMYAYGRQLGWEDV